MCGLFRKKEKTFKTIEMLEEFRGEDGDGLDLLRQHKLEEALKYFDVHLKQYPKSVYYMYGKACALSYLEIYHDAIKYYDNIIETFDKYLTEYWFTAADLFEVTFTSLYDKAKVYRRIGKESDIHDCYEKAMDCIDSLIELSEEEHYGGFPAKLVIFKARVFGALQEYDEALECLQIAAEIHKKLGEEEFYKFKERLLNEWMEEFGELKNFHGFSWLMGFCVNCGNSSLTEDGFCNNCSGTNTVTNDLISDADLESLKELNNKATELNNLTRYKEALEYSNRALAINPNYVYALNNKGFALYYLERYEEAIEYNDMSLVINPKDPDVLTGKGRSLAALGRYQESIDWFEKALEIEPNFVFALNSKGTVLIELGRYREAMEYYDKALAIDPRYFLAIINKATVLIYLKQFDEAIKYYDKALEIHPNHAEACINKGFALGKAGRFKEQDQWFANKITELET